jgi:hypothetical protein
MKSQGWNSPTNERFGPAPTTEGVLTRVKLYLLVAIALAFAVPMSMTAGNTSEATIDHSGWVQAPGALIRPDCVHEVPNGATVETANGQITGDVTLNGTLIAHYDACPEDPVTTRPQGRTASLASAPGGWVEASRWNSNESIDDLWGYWTVPMNPKQNGGLIYLFNGMVNTDGTWIVQPVLQYGKGAGGGGNNWVIASWIVGPNGFFFHSPLLSVNSGDTLLGYTVLRFYNARLAIWNVEAKDVTTGAITGIHAPNSQPKWPWAYNVVLEAYSITSCDQFPPDNGDAFRDTRVYKGPPGYIPTNPEWSSWFPSWQGPACNFSIVQSATTSTLKWVAK